MDDEGTYICYRPRNFKEDSLHLIGIANQILAEYDAQGLVVTLRQLYYQFVHRKVMPNQVSSYNRLGELISAGRLAGLVSWTAVEDRLRGLRGLRYYEDPKQAVTQLRESYRRDLWQSQPWRPEVWIEKDALTGAIDAICNELRVDFFACRGYNSQSEQWRAGQRFQDRILRGQRPIVFHLGDHDPSGLDMTRDNRDRLSMFAGVPVQVVRLALTRAQIEEHDLPPDPAKVSDSRASAYIEEHGDGSWELDALDPATLRDLIRDAVLRIRDPKLWDDALRAEADDLRFLDEVISDADLG